jgi:hypothetical protein
LYARGLSSPARGGAGGAGLAMSLHVSTVGTAPGSVPRFPLDSAARLSS